MEFGIVSLKGIKLLTSQQLP